MRRRPKRDVYGSLGRSQHVLADAGEPLGRKFAPRDIGKVSRALYPFGVDIPVEMVIGIRRIRLDTRTYRFVSNARRACSDLIAGRSYPGLTSRRRDGRRRYPLEVRFALCVFTCTLYAAIVRTIRRKRRIRVETRYGLL